MKRLLGRSSVLVTIIKYVLSFEGPCFLGGKHFKQPSLPGWKVKDKCRLALTENDFKLFSIGHSVHYDILRRL